MRGKKLTINEFIERARKIHDDKYDYLNVNYINAHTKIEIVCPYHGKFFQVPRSHLEGIGCPCCGIEKMGELKRDTLSIFVLKAKKVHGNKYSYKKSIYTNNDTKIKILCKKHGVFNQTPMNHLKGRGCPKCGNENNKAHQPSNIKKFIRKVELIHNNRYDYTHSKYINSRTKIKIICKKHGLFFQLPSIHLLGQGCPKCFNRISKPETKFLNYLKIPDTKENRQVLILRKKVDGYDDKTKTIYEFLGDYWHGNPRIHNPKDINRANKKTFGELYENTFNKKFKILKENGYIIKYIWECDWDEWNKNPNKNIPIINY